MNALGHYLGCLVIIHAAWVYFYLCGTLVTRWKLPEPNRASTPLPGAAVVGVVVSTACGMALTAFATFALGLLHLLYPATLLVFLAAPAALFATVLNDPPWRAAFWRPRLAEWRSAVSPATIGIYAVAVVFGLATASPDLGSDGTTGYLVYAVFWADAHHLAIDWTLRSPFYTYNWVLLQTWFAMFRLMEPAQTLSWLTAVLSLFGIYGYAVATSEESGRRAPAVHVVVGVLAAAAIGGSAIFFSLSTKSLVDIPIGMFLLVCGLALAEAIRTRRIQPLAAFILCAAFFCGLKMSLVAFVPVFAAAVVFAGLARGMPRKHIAVALAALAVFTAPWFVKNFIQAGDPITPLFNLALHGVDPKWSPADLRELNGELHAGETGGAVQRMQIPLTIITQGDQIQFREASGATLIELLLWLPAAVAAYALLRRRTIDYRADVFALAALVVYGIAYWVATSFVGRYSLVYLPAFGALVGALAVRAAIRVPSLRWAVAIAVAVFAIPTASNVAAARDLWASNEDFYEHYVDRPTWMAPRGPIYPEVEYVCAAMRRSPTTNRAVYRPFIEVDRLYFQECGLQAIGDVFGPERYADFEHAIFDDRMGDWVKRFSIGAFVIPNVNYPVFSTSMQRRLDEELKALGFRRVQLRPQFVIYVAADVK